MIYPILSYIIKIETSASILCLLVMGKREALLIVYPTNIHAHLRKGIGLGTPIKLYLAAMSELGLKLH